MIRIKGLVKYVLLACCIPALLLSPVHQLSAAPSTTTTKQDRPLSVFISGSAYVFQSQPYLSNGTVYIPLREVSNALHSAVTWNSKNKEITIIQPKQNISLTLGKSTAIRNNKEIRLAAAPIIKDNQVFVSLRSVGELLQAKVDWNSKLREVEITPSSNLVMLKKDSSYYWLNRSSGDVYYAASSSSEPKLAGTMNIEIQGYSDVVLKSSGRTTQLIVTDNYGEPMINTDVYSALLIDGSIVKQTKAHYWKRFVPNVTYYNDQPIMTNGKTLYVMDSAGKLNQEYDLVQIVGLDENYSVEGIGSSYVLVRPNEKGLLTLINLNTLETVQIYKQLNAKEQEYAEMNDVPYYGDEIVFEREKEGILYFSYYSIFDNQKHSFTYKLSKE